jgi:hypothetical protein
MVGGIHGPTELAAPFGTRGIAPRRLAAMPASLPSVYGPAPNRLLMSSTATVRDEERP